MHTAGVVKISGRDKEEAGEEVSEFKVTERCEKHYSWYCGCADRRPRQITRTERLQTRPPARPDVAGWVIAAAILGGLIGVPAYLGYGFGVEDGKREVRLEQMKRDAYETQERMSAAQEEMERHLERQAKLREMTTKELESELEKLIDKH